MRSVISMIDRMADLFAFLGKVAILLLIASMLYEVLARYLLNAPTLWAFDISYMLNGSIFLLGAAFALKEDAHVRIDFLSQLFPRRTQQWINGLLYLLVLLPIFVAFSWVSSSKAYKAFLTQEVESVSPWAPLVWPFYGLIALGLIAFAFQFLSEGLKFVLGLSHPGEGAQKELDEETSMANAIMGDSDK